MSGTHRPNGIIFHPCLLTSGRRSPAINPIFSKKRIKMLPYRSMNKGLTSDSALWPTIHPIMRLPISNKTLFPKRLSRTTSASNKPCANPKLWAFLGSGGIKSSSLSLAFWAMRNKRREMKMAGLSISTTSTFI